MQLKLLKLFLLLSLLFSACLALGELVKDPSNKTAASGPNIEEIVHQKLYPGGVDEGQLEVQESIPNPTPRVNVQSVQAEVLEDIRRDNEGEEGDSFDSDESDSQ